MQTVGLLSLEQSETLFKILKKTLSGSLGKNLLDISFTTEQVSDSEEHKLLMKLRDSELEDAESRHAIYEKIINSFSCDDSYIIFLGCDKYDVPNRSKNDEEMEDDSDEMFRYILCSVCPVKLTKAGIGFSAADNTFRNIGADMAISAPEIGLTTEVQIFTMPSTIQRVREMTIRKLPIFFSMRNFRCLHRSRWRTSAHL